MNMLESLFLAHKLMCQRKHVSWEYTPVIVVPEYFYNDNSVFDKELFDKIIEGSKPDMTQSPEERAAVGQRYLVHVNKIRQNL